MPTTSKVFFYLPGEGDLAGLAALDPDTSPHELQTGERAWTLQTYLRLRRAGLPVELTAVVPASGTLVFHAKHKHEIYRHRRDCRDTLLVALRGDRNPVAMADFEILQNAGESGGARTFTMPHWPQPGLIPRDPERGGGLRVATYKGFAANLDRSFSDPWWQSRLSELGIRWVFDAVPFDRHAFRRYAVDWSSYREVDAVVAVRPPDPHLHGSKPATKLINAWIAGVPAILGPEQACRQLRRGELDYLEVSSADEAWQALRRLCEQPGMLRAMVENGRARAAEFSVERLVEVWSRLLFETLPRAAAESGPRSRHMRLGARFAGWLRRVEISSQKLLLRLRPLG